MEKTTSTCRDGKCSRGRNVSLSTSVSLSLPLSFSLSTSLRPSLSFSLALSLFPLSQSGRSDAAQRQAVLRSITVPSYLTHPPLTSTHVTGGALHSALLLLLLQEDRGLLEPERLLFSSCLLIPSLGGRLNWIRSERILRTGSWSGSGLEGGGEQRTVDFQGPPPSFTQQLLRVNTWTCSWRSGCTLAQLRTLPRASRTQTFHGSVRCGGFSGMF